MDLLTYTTVWFLVALGLLAITYLLATKGIIFTFCEEGQILFVVAGGNFKKIIYSINGWVYDENLKMFVPGQKKEGLPFGLHWVGIPFFNRVHSWDFVWNKWSKEENETAFKMVSRKANVSSLIFQFPYAIKVPEVEIQGQIEIDFELLVTTRSIAPYTALFLTGTKWLDIVVATIETVTKECLGQYDIDTIRKMKVGEPTMDEFKARVIGLTPDLIKLAGQQVVDVRLLRYTQIGAQALKDAAQAAEKSRLEGDGLIEAARQRVEVAKKDAETIDTLATAEEKRLQKTTLLVAKGGHDAVELEKWRLMQGNKLITYVEGGSGAKVNITPPPPKS